MQESIAGTIGEFDEAEAFLAAEPFDHPMDWRAGRCREPRLCEPGPGSQSAGLRLVVIGVEVATLRVTEILMSHFGT